VTALPGRGETAIGGDRAVHLAGHDHQALGNALDVADRSRNREQVDVLRGVGSFVGDQLHGRAMAAREAPAWRGWMAVLSAG
jgi:hypothetical protein